MIHSMIYGGGERSKINFSQFSAGKDYWKIEIQESIPVTGATDTHILQGYTRCSLSAPSLVTQRDAQRIEYELVYFYTCENQDFSNWIMLGTITWNFNSFQKTYQLKKLIQAKNPRVQGATLGYTIDSNVENLSIYLFGGVGNAGTPLNTCEYYIFNAHTQEIQYQKEISFINTENATSYKGLLHPMEKTYLFYDGTYTDTSTTSGKKSSLYYYLASNGNLTRIQDPYRSNHYHSNHGSGTVVIGGTPHLYLMGGLDNNNALKNYCTTLKFNENGVYQSLTYTNTYRVQGESKNNAFYVLTGVYLPQEDYSGLILHGFLTSTNTSANSVTYSDQSYRVLWDGTNGIYFYPITKEQFPAHYQFSSFLISNPRVERHYPGQWILYGGATVNTNTTYKNVLNPNTKTFLYSSDGSCWFNVDSGLVLLDHYVLLGEQYVLFDPAVSNYRVDYQSMVMIPITKDSLYLDRNTIKKSEENTIYRTNTSYTGYVELESNTIDGHYWNDGSKENPNSLSLQ